MARERTRDVDLREDVEPREPDPPRDRGDPVGVDRIPAVHEHDLAALHHGPHAQEGREVEHVVGPAVDQRDPPALEAADEAVQDRDRRREEPPLGDLDELLRYQLCASLGGDGLLPGIPWAPQGIRGDPGEVAESAREVPGTYSRGGTAIYVGD